MNLLMTGGGVRMQGDLRADLPGPPNSGTARVGAPILSREVTR